jgi:hypothetical protein
VNLIFVDIKKLPESCPVLHIPAFLVALPPVRDLLLLARHLFVAAIDGWGSPGTSAESANQNMTAGPVAFGAGAVLKGSKAPDAGNAAAEGNGLTG